eukprot:GFKZ01002018.1.p1 GENE.GFKZ01002018.1~~GFKZ01002018.1.p1  ORF type:complete len:610 (-),score=58.66 GFKZ01002018.1:122-1951(-)
MDLSLDSSFRNVAAPGSRYVSLSVLVTKPLSQLPAPPGELSFPTCIPVYRLNLLATDNTHLYLAHSTSRIAVYRIHRSKGLSLVPIASVPLPRPTTINNIRFFNSSSAGPLLIMAGGCERPAEPASLSILRLPTAQTVTPEFWESADTRIRRFRYDSAWGLDIYQGDATNDPRIAFSNNSRRIVELSLANLMLGDQDVQMEAPHVLPVIHSNNIPCVSFSNDGQLLASASLDGTYAIYDMRRGGEVLYRSVRPNLNRWRDFESMEMGCWMVYWVNRKMVTSVAGGDVAWGEQRTQRNRTRVLTPFEFSLPNIHDHGLRQSVFDCMNSDTVGKDDAPLPLYNDAGGDGQRDWVGSLGCGPSAPYEGKESNDVAGVGASAPMDTESHEDYKDREGANSQEEQRRDKHMKAMQPDGHEMPMLNIGVGFQMDCDKCEVDEKNKRDERDDNYKLLLVGRRAEVTLYKVKYEKHNSIPGCGERRRLLVEKVDMVTVYRRREPWRSGWCIKVEEVPSLGVLVLAVTGLGVVLLRVSENNGRERLFTDSTLTRIDGFASRDLVVSGTRIAGMCVVEPEGSKDCVGHPVEVWVAWVSGQVKCWEIWREGGVINSAVCV